MLNTEYLAVVNAIQQTGMITKGGTVNSTNITVNYNPNHGVLGDLLESGVDKALGHYLFGLFKDSPHSTYYCGETQIDGKNQFKCGG